MSGTAAIAIVVVVWLFVLAPLALRGHKPIRRTSKAFDETRVVYEGGSDIPERRRPTFTRKDVRPINDADQGASVEEISSEDVLIEDTPPVAPAEDHAAEIEGVVVAEHNEPDVADACGPQDDKAELIDMSMHREECAEYSADNDTELAPQSDQQYEIKQYYSLAADSLHPRAAAEVIDDDIERASAEPDSEEIHDDPSPEDQQFVAQHPGRGWYNPEADAHRASTRYQRRQRTLIVLLALVAIGVVVGFGFGGKWWYMALVSTVVTALYLFELRRQVCLEREIRRRRVHHLRRARMGVRMADPDSAVVVPERLRHPGAVVLEMDDESPDFEHLDTRVVEEAYDDYVEDTSVEVEQGYYFDMRKVG